MTPISAVAYCTQRPLGVVRAPQPDAVAGLEAEAEQAAGAARDALGELVVRPAHALVAGDERLDVAVGGDGAGQVGADRLVEQRDVGRSRGRQRHRDPLVRGDRRYRTVTRGAPQRSHAIGRASAQP